jgi:hypothetical protein
LIGCPNLGAITSSWRQPLRKEMRTTVAFLALTQLSSGKASVSENSIGSLILQLIGVWFFAEINEIASSTKLRKQIVLAWTHDMRRHCHWAGWIIRASTFIEMDG